MQAAPGNHGELSLPSRQITVADSAYNPGANKSTIKGTTGGQGDGPRGGMRPRGNVIKSARPQKPQRCGALGSSSKFSGLDRCSHPSAVVATGPTRARSAARVAAEVARSRVRPVEKSRARLFFPPPSPPRAALYLISSIALGRRYISPLCRSEINYRTSVYSMIILRGVLFSRCAARHATK